MRRKFSRASKRTKGVENFFLSLCPAPLSIAPKGLFRECFLHDTYGLWGSPKFFAYLPVTLAFGKTLANGNTHHQNVALVGGHTRINKLWKRKDVPPAYCFPILAGRVCGPKRQGRKCRRSHQTRQTYHARFLISNAKRSIAKKSIAKRLMWASHQIQYNEHTTVLCRGIAHPANGEPEMSAGISAIRGIGCYAAA